MNLAAKNPADAYVNPVLDRSGNKGLNLAHPSEPDERISRLRLAR